MKDIRHDKNIIHDLCLSGKDFYFSLGSKSPHKNYKFIIECAKNNPDDIFVVSGNMNNSVFNNVKEEEEIKNVIYTGYLNDEQLVTLYKECKAFIFPSLYEGFGIPPLEALTVGCKKIILSNIPVFKEISAS